jgi:hypothetical protein
VAHGRFALNRIMQSIASGRVERATADLVTPYEPLCRLVASISSELRNLRRIEKPTAAKKESRRTMRKNFCQVGNVLLVAKSLGLSRSALQVHL